MLGGSYFCYNLYMSYITFGYFGHGPEDEVIKTANKQKMAADVAYAVLSPVSFAVKKGVAVVAAGKNGSISNEQYVKAVIIKVMKDNFLIPDTRLRARIRTMVKEILKEEAVVSDHPHWATPNYKKNGYK